MNRPLIRLLHKDADSFINKSPDSPSLTSAGWLPDSERLGRVGGRRPKMDLIIKRLRRGASPRAFYLSRSQVIVMNFADGSGKRIKYNGTVPFRDARQAIRTALCTIVKVLRNNAWQ
ncbi:hypothetical protein NDU88_006481 [Pleurodeles waltl]|uniref:Uncharacterized protein n=1 Tax=Pleurodeles waltl TaxID=8319 RepID=A0AAV7WE63_PLEWA|nr:hypothetical protein NDU88_006481 [Pleurodeles waltl]